MSQPVSTLLAINPSTLPSLDAVWRASELAQNQLVTMRTGFDELDKELPSNGWPVGALTEILQHQPGLHEWRLLYPALRACSQQGTVALVGSPHLPHLAALAGQGIDHRNIVLVEAQHPAERLWAAEQVLRCKEVSALLVWLPQARSDQLRRLQLASANPANGRPRLVFAFRPQATAHESSAAPLRLVLSQGRQHLLSVEILKRKGPTLDQPLLIAAQVPSLLALRSGGRHSAAPVGFPVPVPVPAPAAIAAQPSPELSPLFLVPSTTAGLAMPAAVPIEIAQDSSAAAWAMEPSHAVDRTASPRPSRKHRPLALA
jgi:protein ImuA